MFIQLTSRFGPLRVNPNHIAAYVKTSNGGTFISLLNDSEWEVEESVFQIDMMIKEARNGL